MEPLDVFKITIDEEYADGEDLGIDQIAFTSKPAIKTKGYAFSSDIKPLKFSDDVKMRIAAPVMIPMDIYRNDEFGEYYVQFSKTEIEKIHTKFMYKLNNSNNKFNLEHSDKEVPAFLFEIWLVGDNNKADRSYSEFGIEVPPGTLFAVAQITDEQYYKDLVKNDQIGFSIEGFLGLRLNSHLTRDKFINETYKKFING